MSKPAGNGRGETSTLLEAPPFGAFGAGDATDRDEGVLEGTMSALPDVTQANFDAEVLQNQQPVLSIFGPLGAGRAAC